MNKSDIELYKEIQRNAEMGMKAIDTIQDKVYDDDLSLQLSKLNMKYVELRNKSLQRLVEGKAEPYHSNAVQDLILKSGIHMNTMLNTSTSHIADMVIQGSTRGVTQMCKSMNRYGGSAKESVEMAKEFMDFEENSIKRLKKYL